MSGSAMNPTGDELGGGVRVGALVAAGSGCACTEASPAAASGAASARSRPRRRVVARLKVHLGPLVGFDD